VRLQRIARPARLGLSVAVTAAATAIRRLTSTAIAVGVATSLLWGGFVVFLLALGGDSPRSSLSSAISIGVPFLHIGLFVAAVLVVSRHRPLAGPEPVGDS
jgi:hypothetical protein